MAQLVDEDLQKLVWLNSGNSKICEGVKAFAQCCPTSSDGATDSLEHVLKYQGPDRQEKYDEADAAPETYAANARTPCIRSSGAGVNAISVAWKKSITPLNLRLRVRCLPYHTLTLSGSVPQHIDPAASKPQWP